MLVCADEGAIDDRLSKYTLEYSLYRGEEAESQVTVTADGVEEPTAPRQSDIATVVEMCC